MHRVQIIDSHTGGEPTRIVISGARDLGSGSIADQLEVFRSQQAYFRSAVVNEPRGSDVLVGALLTKPSDPSCSCGVIFFNNVGTLGMCGHGTIGLIATLAHMGRIGPGDHRIDTSVGVVTDGPDIITGTAANETFSGIPTGSSLRGRGTVDKLTGGGGNDLFVLGDADGIFYDDGNSTVPGTNDMAWITDFSAGDKIRLYSDPTYYQLSTARYAGLRGVQINALPHASSTPEPIGFVQAATLTTLTLTNSEQFIYL